MEHAPRRRCGSFRQEDDEDEVQFLTPACDEGGPEPLDFSKLDLNLEDQGEDEYDEDEEERQQELIMTRGRSRSRSVHANDDNSYVPDGIPKNKGLSPEAVQQQMDARKNVTGEKGPTPPVPVDRSGPLQHREVVALQKVNRSIAVKLFPHFDRFNSRDWRKLLKILEKLTSEKMKKREWLLMLKRESVCLLLRIIYLPIPLNLLDELNYCS